MKEEINKEEIQKFHRDGVIFTVLLLVCVVSIVPLSIFLGYYAFLICGPMYIMAIYYAVRLERYKKKYDIQTYREIVAFTEGRKLDEIEKARESGKRPYQHVLSFVAAGVVTFVITIFIAWLMRSFIL